MIYVASTNASYSLENTSDYVLCQQLYHTAAVNHKLIFDEVNARNLNCKELLSNDKTGKISIRGKRNHQSGQYQGDIETHNIDFNVETTAVNVKTITTS